MDEDLVIPEEIDWDEELENLDTDGILLEHEARTRYNEACQVTDAWGSVRFDECIGLRATHDDTGTAVGVNRGEWDGYPPDACIGTVFFTETVDALLDCLDIDRAAVSGEDGEAIMRILHNVLVQGVTIGLQVDMEACAEGSEDDG